MWHGSTDHDQGCISEATGLLLGIYVAFIYHNISKLVITLSFTGYDCGFTWFMKPGFQLYPHCHCHYYYYADSDQDTFPHNSTRKFY